MSPIVIEVFICIAFILLCYHCCGKNARDRYEDSTDSRGNDDHDDLRRFRERLSERGGVRASAQDGDNGAVSVADRKELIEKNLFSRKIKREDSVKELSRLLAISRGGVVDEELGECAPAPSGGDGATLDDPSSIPNNPTDVTDTDASALSESSLPTPTAPTASPRASVSASAAAAATIPIDTIATAMSTPQPDRPDPPASGDPPTPADPPASDRNNPPMLNPTLVEPIRNLWSNLTHNIQELGERSLERETATSGASSVPEADQTNAAVAPIARKNSILNTTNKIECSICLDSYSPNETICWAKDGGDPPTLSSASVSINNDMGCDHIFHKECIVAWLQDHDECPLCRRKVVHTDADVRFAGWEM